MNNLLLYLFLLLGTGILSAQTGPANIGDTLNPSSLKAWYMGDQGVSKDSLDNVLTWKDLSYYKNDLVSVSNYATKFVTDTSGSYVHFTKNGQLKTSDATIDFSNDSATIFVVASGPMTGSLYSFATKNSFNNEMTFLNNRTYHHTSSGTMRYLDHSCVDSLLDSDIRVVGNTFEGGTNINYFNNGLESSLNTVIPSMPIPFTETAKELKLGYRYKTGAGVQEFFRGKIYEFIYFDEVLSDSARMAVEDYLRCKYSIDYTTCTALSSTPCNPTLSIEETEAIGNGTFKLYPNPVSSQLNLVVDEALGATAFQLVNVMGQVVKFDLLTATEQQVDVQQMPKGIYFVRLLKEQRVLSTAKFIKK